MVLMILFSGCLGNDFFVETQVSLDTDRAKRVAETDVNEAIKICKDILEEDIGDIDDCFFSVAKHLAFKGRLNDSSFPSSKLMVHHTYHGAGT